MAKKFRPRIENVKPSYEATGRTIGCNGVTINDIIRNVYNEVGTWSLEDPERRFSQLPGSDPNGIPLRTLTYGTKDPLMVRYEYIRDYEDAYNSTTEQQEIDTILSAPGYSYDHDTEIKNKGKKNIFRYERKSRPYITYDEEYFQHIFNWPTEHTMQQRKVGGFVFETECCEGTTTYYEHSATYPGGTMTLDKVESELYYIDDYWGYQPLTLNPDGTIQDSSGDITDRVGEPVIYHGGTDDDCLFFHYVVDLEDTNAVSTTNLVVVGDTVNGAEITNVINYVVDIALKRTASRRSNKGIEDKEITQAQFLALDAEYTVEDYNNTKAWLKLNTADGIAKGNKVYGKGIRENTVVTGVDESRNRVYLSETLSSKKVKLVRFLDDTINRVSKNTLCYAVISGATFEADTNYAVTRNGQSTGITICARAGKGIINRSAIVGTYFSKNKKDIEYSPIFYSVDPNCKKETFEDENGEYILGTVVWNDNSRLSGKFLLTSPKTKEAYEIATAYSGLTYGLIDKETLEMFLAQYNPNNKNTLVNIYGMIADYVKTTLNNKKAAATFDDVCRDDIQMDYTLAFSPYMEMFDLNSNIIDARDSIQDECLPFIQPVTPAQTIDEAKQKFIDIINNSVENSVVMPEQVYKKLVSDEDSLMNTLSKGTDTILKSVPKNTKVDNLPPVIEGQDDSGVIWSVPNFRDLPPAMDRVKFFLSDLNIGTDRDLDPTFNMDPATTVNQPRIIIRSKPRWIWNGSNSWSNTKTHAGVCGSFTSTLSVNVSIVGGYLDTITSSTGAVTVPPPIQCEGDPPCTCSTGWTNPQAKGDNKNIHFGEKKEPWDFSKLSTEQEGYISATNWGLHPSLRDLDNIDRPDNEDILAPTASIFPKILWAPNINYQMDFHKFFWFRMDEMSELIGESIDNSGNPYMDDPIRAKITQDIQAGDTTINVQSTEGFLSSGYLIIPKYIKKLYTTETGNVDSYFTYCGEEIIYYKSKTQTSFVDCERELFGTNSDLEITIPARSLEVGVRYQIQNLGTTDWESCGAGKNAVVGTVFVATKDATGTGTVQLFGSNSSATTSENIDVYEDPPKIPVISSYEKGFSVSQHWIFKLKED